MIRVQLWRNGMMLIEQKVFGSKAADQVLDRLITEIHMSKYGDGRFDLDAHHFDSHGIFIGSYFTSAVAKMENCEI